MYFVHQPSILVAYRGGNGIPYGPPLEINCQACLPYTFVGWPKHVQSFSQAGPRGRGAAPVGAGPKWGDFHEKIRDLTVKQERFSSKMM